MVDILTIPGGMSSHKQQKNTKKIEHGRVLAKNEMITYGCIIRAGADISQALSKTVFKFLPFFCLTTRFFWQITAKNNKFVA